MHHFFYKLFSCFHGSNFTKRHYNSIKLPGKLSRNTMHFEMRLFAGLALAFGFSFQTGAQINKTRTPSDAELKSLVDKYISTPVKQVVQPNGDLFLQRNFSAYLHAMPAYNGIVTQAQQDFGHNHNSDALEAFLNRPHPSVATLEKYFWDAASEFGVPLAILRSYGQLQSNWAQVSESMYGSWGIMGLIENNAVNQISEAAQLLNTSTDNIKTDAKTNIRAAAALLAQYQTKYGKALDPEDWFESTCDLTGFTDKAMQISFAKRVFETIEIGSKTISIWGEIILLHPNEKISVPQNTVDKLLKSNLQQLGNGTPDYPAAIYNLTACNFGSRPVGAPINFYFVHYIATGTYEGAISWFKNCTSGVSAHYVVRNSDGQITQVVDEANRAFSQGVQLYNDQGIGVEHEVLATNLSMWDNTSMLQAAGRLASDVCNRQSIPKQRRGNNGDRGIYGHSDVRATDCPNMTQPRWDAFMAQVQGALPAVGTPTLFSIASTSGSGQVSANWKANTELSLLGYRLYYATGDNLNSWALAADETTLTPITTSVTLQPAQFKVPPTQPAYHFRLTAVVPNGANPVVESGASDVYSRSWMVTGPKVLIVDGFDRTSGSYPNGTHAFATSYFKVLRDRGLVEISTAANERIEDGTINLAAYDIVVWFVGDESSVNVVFSLPEKNAITTYLNGGGKLLLSGSEIAYNIGRAAAGGYDLAFMTNYLKSTYVGDGLSSYTPATGIAASGFDGLNIPFGIVYPEDFPDNIAITGGSSYILNYSAANTRGGIAYKGVFGAGINPGTLVYITFPLETASDISMSQFMEKALAYFNVPPLPASPIAINDAAIVQSGFAKRINALSNDNGNGSSLNPSSIFISTPPANGSALVNADGTMIYVPANGYTGPDAFAYKVAATNGVFSNAATVNLTIEPTAICAATPPEVDDNFPLRDLRGAWVTSVFNLDWPTSRTASPATQQADLLRIMDTLRNTGFNTIFLQVRTGSDALYNSPYEPWSYYLTGTEGLAPNPLWDPLKFAVDAAHARGLDLHAWINPYRARTGSYPLAASHVMNQNPSWILNIGASPILNPGLPAVQEYLANIMADIANRYDVDGIHFDDYFYPSAIATEDAATYAANNPNNIGNIQDWRRDNVNRMIARVYDTLQQISTLQNRNVVFGVSPFGIWKSGTPTGISGQSSFSALYCDPIAWLQAGKVDYLAPQLYWKITGAQDYDRLSQWWNDQGKLYNRHIYTGHAWYKMVDANNWAASEIEAQINLNRLPVRNEIRGEIGYRNVQITANSKTLKTTLQQGLYRYKSYAPAFAWKDAICPNPPTNVTIDGDTLRWTVPTAASDGDLADKYVVYKFEPGSNLTTQANDGTKVIDIVANNKDYVLHDGVSRYVVTALDKNNNESIGAASAIPDVVLCPNGNTSLQAGVVGNSYQWQILVDGNWQILANPTYFSGISTATLNIVNLPVSFYGTQLRCLSGGNTPGPVYTLRFGTTWTGFQNSNWSNAANWNCGLVPDINLDAIIPANVPNLAIVDIPNAAARRVNVKPGATLNVAAGNNLTISQ